MSEAQPIVQYRDIPDCPGYRVGDDGSVWSCLVRFRPAGDNNGFAWMPMGEWRQLRPNFDRGGYLQLHIRGKTRRVHHLVLTAFGGPRPEGFVCRHLDGIRTNNQFANLRWGTEAENSYDRRLHRAQRLLRGKTKIIRKSRCLDADMSTLAHRVGGTKLEYREIAGFPGYRVGSDGSVWSCRVKVANKGGGWVGMAVGEWRKLKARAGTHGHLAVTLYPGRETRLVHRLILEAFAGPCPSGMMACHYPDPNPANNHIANLRWDTSKANQADSIIHGTKAHGQKHFNSKLTEDDVRQIHLLDKGVMRRNDIAARFGITVGTVKRIVRGASWAHLMPKVGA